MKQTRSQKAIAYLKKLAKKNKIARQFAICMILVITLFAKIGCYFSDNKKRFLSACATVSFFVLSCSFAVPVEGSIAANDAFYLSKEISNTVEDEIIKQEMDINSTIEQFEKELEETNQSTVVTKEDSAYSLDDILQSGTNVYKNGKEHFVEETKTKEELSIDDWELILINKQHPVPDDYEMELAVIKESMQCDARILPYLMNMLQAAQDDGVTLIVCSPYRDIERQEYLFDCMMNSFLGMGYSYMESYQLSSNTVTVPGASEHQIGLALDFLSNDYWSLDVGFANTDAGIWLKENAHEFGFTLRYPEDKVYITGIQFEPWHYRYVGVVAATIMKEENLTLEELVEGL